MQPKTLFLVVALFSISNTTQGQDFVYDVMKGDKNYGSMRVFKTQQFHETQYRIETDVLYSFLKKFDMDFLIKATFQDGILKSCFAQDIVNEKERAKSIMTCISGSYEATKDDKVVELKTNKIPYSITLLYYEEPINQTQVFSERHLCFFPIKKVAPHKYEVYISDSKRNYYTYKNGICLKVEVKHWFSDFTFVLRENNQVRSDQ